MKSAFVPRAKDGQDTILEAVAEAAGAGNWEELSIQALLLGSQQAGFEGVWKLDQFEMFQSHPLPAFVLRSVPALPARVLVLVFVKQWLWLT